MNKLSSIAVAVMEFIIVFIGAPFVILLSIWSMTGVEMSLPYIQATIPSQSTMMISLLIACTTLIFTSTIRISRQHNYIKKVKNNINVVLDSLDSIVRNGKNSSIKQVELMLDEAEILAKQGRKVDILQAHFEPNTPAAIFDANKRIINEAIKNDYNLKWKIIVGQVGSEKESWIKLLKNKIENNSNGKFEVYSLTESKPSLNIIIIPQINQVYLGLGDWLGENSTGGVWIKSAHFSDAINSFFIQIESLAIRA